MLATLSGDLCLIFGLALLLLPLLAVELSRPRDGVWGAVVLLLGLVLVTSNDRLRGAPMLAVLCAALLIGRLSLEVSQARWSALSTDEQRRFASKDHWRTSLEQLLAAVLKLGGGLGELVQQFKPPQAASTPSKKWVRPEAPSSAEPVEEISGTAEDSASKPSETEPED